MHKCSTKIFDIIHKRSTSWFSLRQTYIPYPSLIVPVNLWRIAVFVIVSFLLDRPSPLHPIVSSYIGVFEILSEDIIHRKCGRHPGRLPDITKSFTLFGQGVLAISWWWPKYLSLHRQISSGTLIIQSYSWSSCVLIRCSNRTLQI